MIYTLKIVVLVFVILFESVLNQSMKKNGELDKLSRLILGAEAVLMFA